MRDLLKAVKGCRLIAKGQEHNSVVLHYLLPDGHVLEVVHRPKRVHPARRSRIKKSGSLGNPRPRKINFLRDAVHRVMRGLTMVCQ